MKVSTAVLLAIIATTNLTFAGIIFPEPDTPFRVMRMSQEVTDPDRPDPFNETHVRRVMIDKYTPVPKQACLETCRVPYMPETIAAVQDAAIDYYVDWEFQGEMKWSSGLLAQAEIDFCCEVEEGSNSDQTGFPTVVFGPGYNASRYLYSSIAQNLAGMGYNVIVTDHPYDANIVEFPDGTSTLWAPLEFTLEIAEFLIRERVADVSLILDTLGFTDDDRAINVGHSLGGAAAVLAVTTDARVAGGVNLDGSMYGTDTADRPVLLFAAEDHPFETDPSWDDFVNRTRPLGTWVKWLTLEASVHWSFTDYAVFSDIAGLREDGSLLGFVYGGIRGERVMEILREYLSDFVRFVLNDVGVGLLEGPSEDFDDVKFVE